MKYYIIAGEASGDLHGSNLIKEVKKLDAEANIRCWGGDLMRAAGATLAKHYHDLAFMGFAEIVMNLKNILGNLKFCKEDILQFDPDVLVLINYSAFNLRIAEWAYKPKAKSQKPKAKTVFYIPPQVWAWKESRVPKMKETIDEMIVILPFEKEYYKNKWNWDVDYVGHPLVQAVEEFKQSAISSQPSANNIIALLPGSRKQEIAKKLPIMLEVSRYFPQYQFILAKAPGLEDAFYESFVRNYTNVSSVRNKTYQLLSEAKAALVTSGTATLETALFGVPEVVCYKGSNMSYQIAKRLIKIKYISLVNLIMDKPVVKELIQNELTVKNVKRELSKLLCDETKKAQIKQDYEDLKKMLSAGGNASANAAKIVIETARAQTGKPV
ncbi:lipid-A-disaccharide synthase [Parafilimonas sp.]|uniref:lipid-A-disaccharide synthase n=1 Tax=Parafilimonas sp. TaxID=1969739 RepID=UPI0039E6B80E